MARISDFVLTSGAIQELVAFVNRGANVVKKKSGVPGAGQAVFVDAKTFLDGEYPLLAAHMGDPIYDDGTPRLTSTLLIFAEQGLWKACLSCRDTEEVAFVSASCVRDLLLKLEDGLEADELDWREKKGQDKRRRP